MNIIAVVVTYNRMELLKRNIRCLQQNKPISSIVIVNNGSTDGTTEWLAAQEGLTVINQTNVGGAGGFYTGIQYAYQAGADWIWCMDDDVFPRADCLEQLLPYTGKKDIGILAPRRLLEGEIFTHDFQAYNLSNPFVSMYSKKLAGRHITSPTEIMATKAKKETVKKAVEAEIKDEVFVQFAGIEINVEAVVAAAKADYKAKGHRTPKTVSVYIKPEEGVAYYTVKGVGSEDYKVEL